VSFTPGQLAEIDQLAAEIRDARDAAGFDPVDEQQLHEAAIAVRAQIRQRAAELARWCERKLWR